jgi:23S rRNA pseudouridine2605 synthase
MRKNETAEPQRVQKVLAERGLGSRREIEGWIVAGRLTINGKRAQLGDRVTARDRIAIDGRPVALAEHEEAARPRILAYHKPAGEVCTRSDPEGRPTVFDQLPRLRAHAGFRSGAPISRHPTRYSRRMARSPVRLHPSEVTRSYAVRGGHPEPGTLAALTRASRSRTDPRASMKSWNRKVRAAIAGIS